MTSEKKVHLSVVANLQAQEKSFMEAVKVLRVYFKETRENNNKIKEEHENESKRAAVLQTQRRTTTFRCKVCEECGKTGHLKEKCWNFY